MMGNNSSQLSPSMLASTEGVGNDLFLADMYVMRSTAEATNRAIKNADDGRQQIAISNEMDHAIETDEKSSPQNADIDAQTFEQNALSEKIADCIDNSGIGERSATREDSAIKLGRPTNPSSKKPISVRAAGSTSFSNPSSLNSTSPAVNTNHVTEINEHIHKESTMNQSSLGNHKQCTHSTNKQRSANPTTTIQKRTSTDLYEQIYARGILVHDPKYRVQHQLQAPRQLNQGLQASSQMHHLPPTDIGAPMTAESFYCAKISCYGKEYQLGEYQLYADKIKAQDDAAALVTGPFSFPAFQTPMDYLRARSIEMMQRGISIETSEPCVTVDQRIKYYLQQLSFDLGTSAKEASTANDADMLQNAAFEKNMPEVLETTNESSTSERKGAATDRGKLGIEEPAASVLAAGENTAHYKGVKPSNSKFVAMVRIKGKNPMSMGCYFLQADAALAYDRGANEFKVTGRSHGRARNFVTEEEYTHARNKELNERQLSLEVAGSVAVIEEKISQRVSELRDPSKKQKASAFRGLLVTKRANGETKYHAALYHNKKQHALGSYELECDAAWCYDEAARLWKGTSWKFNFESKNQYLQMRELEVVEKGIDSNVVDSVETVSQLIKNRLGSLTIEPIPECANADAQSESPASDIPEANADSDDKSLIEVKAPKTSKFVGVTCIKGINRYKAQIGVEKNVYSIGQYKMESDAAWCYDKALSALCLADKRTTNFVSFDQYKVARKAEEKIKGENAEDVVKVAAIIQNHIDKVVTKVELNRNVISDVALANRAENETEENEQINSPSAIPDSNDDACNQDTVQAAGMMYKIDVSNRKVIDDSGIESLPASDIPEAIADSDDLSFIATKAPKSSKFVGVTYLKGDNRYKAQIRVEKKMYSLGQYKMESDAACCYDQTLRALCLADKRTTNFVSFDQYKAAREAEEKIRGENTEGIIKVASHIQQQVDKVVANVESNRNAVSDKAGVDRAENETEENDQIDSPSAISNSNDEACDHTVQAAGIMYYVHANDSNVMDDSDRDDDKSSNNISIRPSSNPKSMKARTAYIQMPDVSPSDEAQSNKTFEETKQIHDISPSSEAENEAREYQKGQSDNARSRQVKRKHQGNQKIKKTKMSLNSQSHRALDELNAKNDALMKKWGPLFTDDDWQKPGYEEVHQTDIESMLVELRDTSRSNKRVSKSSETQVLKKKRPTASSHENKKTKRAKQDIKLVDPGISSSKDAKTLPTRSNDTHCFKKSGSASKSSPISCGICAKRFKSAADLNYHGANAVCSKATTPQLAPNDSKSSLLNDQTIDKGIPTNLLTTVATNTTAAREKPHTQKRSISLSPPTNADYQSSDSKQRNENEPEAVGTPAEISKALEPNLNAAEQAENDEHRKSQLSPTKAIYSRDVNRPELILFQPGQTGQLHFPVGCKVWWGLQPDDEGETFNHGTIHNVYFNFSSRVIVYEVQSAGQAQLNEEAGHIMLYEEDIAYAPGSQVYYSASNLLDDEASRIAGEVLYCRTTSSNNTDKVKEMVEFLQNEQNHLKANNADAECVAKIHATLIKLDTKVSVDRTILKQTGIGHIVKSISKLLAKLNNKGAELAANLVEKWRSQIAQPQFYYTLLILGENNENHLVEDVMPSHIKLIS
ncbi:hypothetical protein ACHAWO_000636 [Cyclotella atomus]|uniref:AP2/ERF domain-containing protein n=1 Tax=Cyclotella atomus TaxID=382360 RepID=A0ABD3QAY1_9STRA